MSTLTSSALSRPHNLMPPPSLPNPTSPSPLPASLEEHGTFGQRLHVYEDDASLATTSRVMASEIFVSEKDKDRIEPEPPSHMEYTRVQSPAPGYKDVMIVRNVEGGNWRRSLGNRPRIFYDSTFADEEGESSKLEEKKFGREDDEEFETGLRTNWGGVRLKESWRGEVGRRRTAQPNFRLLEAPTRLECPGCGERVVTATKYKRGRAVWGTAFGLLVLTGGLLSWVPFCMGEYFKDVIHVCPNCDAKIGRYRRFSV